MKPLKVPLVVAHIIGWIFFQGLPLVFLLGQSNSAGLSDVLFTYAYWQFCFFYVILFYVHSYFLLPYLFAKKKKILYFVLMVLIALSVFKLQPFEQLVSVARWGGPMENRMPPPGMHQPTSNNGFQQRRGEHFQRRGPAIDIISVFLFILTITLSVAIDITRRWRETVQRAARAEADKVNAELSFLKAQINPHFLFNTLNNIYSMAVTQNANTAGTIMKLSNIMRYVTDDVNEDYVSLQSEIDCITDYIDLQKLRIGKKVILEYSVTGDLEDKKIAPLILMTFIENVFKYGTSNHEHSVLTIRVTVSEGRIDFFTQNQLFATDRKVERTGIGIGNTRKRLEHLYPNKHRLHIARENNLFTVELTLYN
jgi:two-component system LytT family sensor kinase